ncbi:MAG: PorT family protein [Bacteroidetes bacterium]|nr:PorT family protein [Bacteroidota bacterium]
MKTIGKFFALLAMLTFTNALMAQISLGVKGGLNVATIHAPEFVNELVEFRNVKNPTIGVVSEFGFGQHFALQSELNFTTKGFKLDEGFDVQLFDIDVPLGVVAVSEFRYLELPLLAKAKFGNDRVEGYVYGGPTLGYAVNGKLTTRAKVFVEFDLFDTKLDLDNIGYERFEVSGTIGAGVAFKGAGGKFFLDARYNHGLTEVYDVPLIAEQVENRNVNLTAGYLWKF